VHRRVNITLPEETIRLLDRAAPKGNRSRVIAAAVRHYVGARSRAQLRRRLRDGAIRRAERDRELAADWFSLDEEAWPQSKR
jgi:CopG family transcriptional regulator / antitoxin EndoAI